MRAVKNEDLTEDKIRVRQYLNSDPGAIWLWHLFCSEKGIQRTDLPHVPAEMVKLFLARYEDTYTDIKMASTELCAELNRERDKVPVAAFHWDGFCKRNAFGIVNPRNLPEIVVQQFLTMYRAGQFGWVSLCSPAQEKEVRKVQKMGGTKQWRKFVEANGHTRYNPLHHTKEFVQYFLDNYDPNDLEEVKKGSREERTSTVRSRLGVAVHKLLEGRLDNKEIVYTTESIDTKEGIRFQARIALPTKLNEVEGREPLPLTFKGEWMPNKQEAKESAAETALNELGKLPLGL